MLGWLQCQLPNVFDYLYLCSLVAINNTHFVLCFVSPPESTFILFPVCVISFQLCLTFTVCSPRRFLYQE